MHNVIYNAYMLARSKLMFLLSTFVFLAIFIYCSYISFFPKKVNAQTPTPAYLSGYAWSDAIGWISFDINTNGNNLITINPQDGSLQNADGVGPGFAWSDNVGWIQFGGLTDIPNGGKNVMFDGSGFTGWFRACAGTENGDCLSPSRTDGWDGWIEFTSTSYDPSTGDVTGIANDPTFGEIDLMGMKIMNYQAVDCPISGISTWNLVADTDPNDPSGINNFPLTYTGGYKASGAAWIDYNQDDPPTSAWLTINKANLAATSTKVDIVYRKPGCSVATTTVNVTVGERTSCPIDSGSSWNINYWINPSTKGGSATTSVISVDLPVENNFSSNISGLSISGALRNLLTLTPNNSANINDNSTEITYNPVGGTEDDPTPECSPYKNTFQINAGCAPVSNPIEIYLDSADLVALAGAPTVTGLPAGVTYKTDNGALYANQNNTSTSTQTITLKSKNGLCSIATTLDVKPPKPKLSLVGCVVKNNIPTERCITVSGDESTKGLQISKGSGVQLTWKLLNSPNVSPLINCTSRWDGVSVASSSSSTQVGLVSSKDFTLSCGNESGVDTKTIRAVVTSVKEF